jgi:hypothetical protein
MKILLNYFYITTLILCVSCKDDICPKNPQYHTFSREELSLFWGNVDSLMIWQNKLQSGVIGENDANNSYGFRDTLKYINQVKDTISYIYGNGVSKYFSTFCKNEIPMVSKCWLYTINNTELKHIEIKYNKKVNNEVVYTIYLNLNNNQTLYCGFSLKDSVKISNNIFDDTQNDTNTVYLKTTLNDYQYHNELLKKCLFFEFKDLKQNEKFKIIYSTKYGFLKIIKNKNYEINRYL